MAPTGVDEIAALMGVALRPDEDRGAFLTRAAAALLALRPEDPA